MVIDSGSVAQAGGTSTSLGHYWAIIDLGDGGMGHTDCLKTQTKVQIFDIINKRSPTPHNNIRGHTKN